MKRIILKLLVIVQKKKNMLNSIECQIENIFTRHTESYKEKVLDKVYNNNDKMQQKFANSITNDFTGFDKSCDFYNNNNNNFVKNSSLSVWSDWTYTNKKVCNSSRKVNKANCKNDEYFQKISKYTKQFDFLPKKLYNLLRHRAKLTNVQRLSSPNKTILCK